MKPASHLRFVERLIPAPGHSEGILQKVRILQQWWSYNPDDYTDWVTKTNGEWRDIELEDENKDDHTDWETNTNEEWLDIELEDKND